MSNDCSNGPYNPTLPNQTTNDTIAAVVTSDVDHGIANNRQTQPILSSQNDDVAAVVQVGFIFKSFLYIYLI